MGTNENSTVNRQLLEVEMRGDTSPKGGSDRSEHAFNAVADRKVSKNA